ncbi:MAG: hypothetical protein KBT57_06805 [bacterium]|nr:hypothetical protein [Candidatus Limimorpha equi]
MKKVVRILGLCALVALATVSCKKDDNNAPQGGKSFRASINQPTDGAKTHIGEWEGQPNYLLWNDNDEIMVYTADGTSATFKTNDANALVAEFTGDIKEADKYVAFYPAANASEADGGFVTLTLPEQQTYFENNFANGAYPMAAYWTGNIGDDVDFQFHSPCAVVCLPLKGDVKVTSIDLTGKYPTDVLAGTLKVDINNFDPANPSAGGYQPVLAKWTVSLSCGDGVQLDPDTPTNFYFVVAAPHTIFKKGLKFDVNYEGGNETLETTENNSLSAETILTMPPAEVNEPVVEGKFKIGEDLFVEFAPANVYFDGTNWVTGTNCYETYTFPSYSGSSEWGLFAYSTDAAFDQNGNPILYGMTTVSTGGNAWQNPYWGFYMGQFKDWGDAIGNGYRTLSKAEWESIIASSVMKYCNVDFGSVEKEGLVIMPYGWEGSLSYNISETRWAELAKNNAVFLPAMGVRQAGLYGPDVIGSHPSVMYWTSTIETEAHQNPGGNGGGAYCLSATKDGPIAVTGAMMEHGMCVHLVKDIQ